MRGVSVCNDCGEEILWLQKPSGGWHRPLDPTTASGVTLEGAVVLRTDPPRLVDTNMLVTYRNHVCRPVRRAPARPPQRISFTDEAVEREREAERARLRKLDEERSTEEREELRWRDSNGYVKADATGVKVIDYECPLCGAAPGMICRTPSQRRARIDPHSERKWFVTPKQPSPAARRAHTLSQGYGMRPWEDESRPRPVEDCEERGTVDGTLRKWLSRNVSILLDIPTP